MTNRTLSPAAQAVLDAAYREMDYAPRRHVQWVTAAALRAAADQVVPLAEISPQEDLESRREAMVWGMEFQTQLTRNQLLSIADELEGKPEEPKYLAENLAMFNPFNPEKRL